MNGLGQSIYDKGYSEGYLEVISYILHKGFITKQQVEEVSKEIGGEIYDNENVDG